MALVTLRLPVAVTIVGVTATLVTRLVIGPSPKERGVGAKVSAFRLEGGIRNSRPKPTVKIKRVAEKSLNFILGSLFFILFC
jgi:hypothetical protein